MVLTGIDSRESKYRCPSMPNRIAMSYKLDTSYDMSMHSTGLPLRLDYGL